MSKFLHQNSFIGFSLASDSDGDTTLNITIQNGTISIPALSITIENATLSIMALDTDFFSEHHNKDHFAEYFYSECGLS